MNRQSKKIYSSLMDRIAIAMILNQGTVLILGMLFELIKPIFPFVLGEGIIKEIVFGFSECAIYFVGFVLPMNIFNKMNKNAEKEIYEPYAGLKMPTWVIALAVTFTLGATIVASYINYYAVNIFGDYSKFTADNLWKAELEHPYQMIIYFTYIAIIPAVVEEYFFRGTVCRVLTVYGKKTAILVSAVLFALMHANVEQLLYSFVAGVLLAWIYVETKNIAIPILVHFLNNGISAVGDILKAIYGQSVYDGYIAISDAIVIALALISLIGLLVYFKKKGRIIDKLIIKPDENGEAVAPLSTKERIVGFFSKGIILFAVYSLVIMIGLIYLSTIS